METAESKRLVLDEIFKKVMAATEAGDIVWTRTVNKPTFNPAEVIATAAFVEDSKRMNRQLALTISKYWHDGEFNTPMGDNVTAYLHLDGPTGPMLKNSGDPRVAKLISNLFGIRAGFNPDPLTRALFDPDGKYYVPTSDIAEMQAIRKAKECLLRLAAQAEARRPLSKISSFFRNLIPNLY